MSFHIYLSGEIHSNWRDQIVERATQLNRHIRFSSPNTDHDASDAAGDILEPTESRYWRDHQSAKVNAIHVSGQIRKADLVIIRFGDKYRQWNAAYDAGFCAASGIPYVTFHTDELTHALKEVDASAMARASSLEQLHQLIEYLTQHL